MPYKKGKDRIGEKYGRLTVVGWVMRGKNSFLKVKCDCGTEKTVASSGVVGGQTKSCGCLKKEGNNYQHGLSKSNRKLMDLLLSLKFRCYNKNCRSYKDYGGRGIKVCDEWLNDVPAFVKWALENGYEPGLSLERVNNNGNYEPSNCKFIPLAEQSRNRTNTLGVEKALQIRYSLSKGVTIVGLSKEYGVSMTAISNIKSGKSYQNI